MVVLELEISKGKYVYIQKITQKSICVIFSEDHIANFSRESGKFRGTPKAGFEEWKDVVIPIQRIVKFLQFNRIDEWDGGWKPKRNSKGVVLNENMLNLSRFKREKNTYQSWFEFHHVTISHI